MLFQNNNKQQTTNNKQQTTNNKQQTTNNEQRTTNNEQRTTNSKQQTANSKQQTANSKQQTANSKQQTANSKQQQQQQQQHSVAILAQVAEKNRQVILAAWVVSGCLFGSGTKASVLNVLAFVCLIRDGVYRLPRVEIR